MKWLLYGAYGYTGELLAREAVKRNMSPILGGRKKEKTRDLALELGLDYKYFSLKDKAAINTALSQVDLVLNCAGPFDETFGPLAQGCLRTKTHYLDITGEIDIFEQASLMSEQAKEIGIVICPGAGFDVVPTDCMAAKLKELMPDAVKLHLGFSGLHKVSGGTKKTMIKMMPHGGRVRCGGKIVHTFLGKSSKIIDFGTGKTLAMAIPWGDVSSAYYTTGIPNIKVFIPTTMTRLWATRAANFIRPFLALDAIQSFLRKRIEKSPKGPNRLERDKEIAHVWGEALNVKGQRLTGRIVTANGYNLTAEAPLKIIQRLKKIEPKDTGYKTPSMLMGADFVTTLKGSGAWSFNNS